jgi:hypothetical protein
MRYELSDGECRAGVWSRIIGASLSATFFGLIVGNFGSAIAFLGIAAAALTAAFSLGY